MVVKPGAGVEAEELIAHARTRLAGYKVPKYVVLVDSLLEAGQFVQVLEHRTGVRIACLEEVALRMGYIDADQCFALGSKLSKSGYGDYLMAVARSAGATG